MFHCLPEELYILSAFFVHHVHSDIMINRVEGPREIQEVSNCMGEILY